MIPSPHKKCSAVLAGRIFPLLPFVLWLYYFRAFYATKFVLIIDATKSFIYTNYYLNNIGRGVYPAWNPFNAWGRPDDFNVRLIGELNPFLYLVLLLNRLGVPVPTAYSLYLISYYFCGMAGFYLLAKRILRDKNMAYIATVLLLFTNLGSNLFNDFGLILITIPIIWFFYFLTAFIQTGQKAFFLGLTFSVMIILTTYLPFFFLTVFFCFLVFFGLFFFREMIAALSQMGRFFRNHKSITILCLAAILLSLMPGLLWYQAAGTDGYIINWRGIETEGMHTANLSLKAINFGGIIGSHTFEGMFTNTQTLNLGMTYVPVFTFLLFLLGAAVPLQRRLILLFGISFSLLFISMGDALPLHGFLHKYIFFFRWFRNLHFVTWLAVPVFILFVVSQLQILLNVPRPNRKMCLYSLIVHVIFFLFLRSLDYVILSSFLCVIFSAIFFTFYFLNGIKSKGTGLLCGLLFLVLLQPVEVFHHLYQNTKKMSFAYGQNPYLREDSYPVFSFTRPGKGEHVERKKTEGFGEIFDTSGFMDGPYFGLKGSYLLHKHLNHDILKEYVRNKLIVYDTAEFFDEERMDLAKVEQSFAHNRNIAFVADKEAAASPPPVPPPSRHARIIRENSPDFEVLDFDLNEIKFRTHFKKKKFLVYNDSFHSAWQASINGKPARLIRANTAFKGLWLPSGENIVHLQYGSGFRRGFNVFLILFFQGFFLYLLYSLLNLSRGPLYE